MTTGRVAAGAAVAGAMTMMATAGVGMEIPAAMPRPRVEVGKAEAVRAATTRIVQAVRIADMADGSEIPAAIPKPPAADGKTAADSRGASGRQAGRTAASRPGASWRRIVTDKTFLIDYEWLGKTLSCRLPAREWEEAEEKLAALRSTGKVVGELLMEGDATPMMTDRIGTC